jgi:accessory gene regulator B
MNKMLDKIMVKLLEGGYVKSENEDIVRFGLELATMKTLISVAVIIVAIVFDSAPAVIAFMAAYQPMRSCCGGYHAKTRSVCFVSSMIVLIFVIIAVKSLTDTLCLISSLFFIITGLGAIFFLAPVDTPSKPFDDVERIVFRKRSLIAAMLSMTAADIFMFFGMDTLLLAVSMAFFFTGLLLVLGRISNRKGAIS